MTLRVAVVTNTSPHHKYFAAQLHQHLDVRCVIIPNKPQSSLGLRHYLANYGASWVFLKVLSKLYSRLSQHSFSNLIKSVETQFLSAVQDYDKIPSDIIHHVATVNSDIAIDLVTQNCIDVICFLGGDIAKANFINSARSACLNIHSGISPFYNGCESAAWVACDNRPNFAGVTLMHMNERIDGGRIISHYLPPITPADDASTLFMKGIKGGVRLLVAAIRNMEQGKPVEGMAQHRSFRYTRGIDWTIYHDLKLRQFHESGRMKKYERPEKIFTYAEERADHFPFSKTLAFILDSPGKPSDDLVVPLAQHTLGAFCVHSTRNQISPNTG